MNRQLEQRLEELYDIVTVRRGVRLGLVATHVNELNPINEDVSAVIIYARRNIPMHLLAESTKEALNTFSRLKSEAIPQTDRLLPRVPYMPGEEVEIYRVGNPQLGFFELPAVHTGKIRYATEHFAVVHPDYPDNGEPFAVHPACLRRI